jgi:chromosome segregation ATPase
MLNFFTLSGVDDGTVYRFRDTSVEPPREKVRKTAAPVAAARPAEPKVLPTNYGDIVAFFRRTVAERKSPYNQLCRAADQLRDYVPDEISRMKVAWKVLGEQVSPEALSLAISTHLNDIDLARQKAARHTPDMVAGETRRLQEEIAGAEQRRAGLADEISQLRARLQALEATQAREEVALTELRQQLQALQSSANSAAFLDQAAENEKNDLLARKVLLGLD